MQKKLIRITTIPLSFGLLLEGQMSYMKDFYNVVAVSSEKEHLEEIGEKEGVSTFVVEMTRKITPLKDLASLFKLYRFLKREKPTIVHTHTPKAGLIGMLASKLARVPVRLHTVAGLPLLEAKGIKRKILYFVEKLTYNCATKVYPNSYGLKAIIEQDKFTTKTKLKVLGNGSSNGIDTEHFSSKSLDKTVLESLKNKFKISKDDFVYIFVGRIVGDKGINELVEAFNDINKDFNNVKLLLIGPFEDDLDPIKKFTKQVIELNNNIITTGFQEDVRPYFAISHVLTFPSYREGFPNVVMQAGAMGLPSIVSDINGCNEIITNGLNGSIVKKKDVAVLKAEMRSYLIDKKKYKKTKENSRQIIVKKYQRSVIMEALLDEYNKMTTNV